MRAASSGSPTARRRSTTSTSSRTCTRSTSTSTSSTKRSTPTPGHAASRCATAEEIHAEQEANADKHIHMPSPSYWPIVLAVALPIMAYGIIYSHALDGRRRRDRAAGGIFGWALEPSVADDSDYDPPAKVENRRRSSPVSEATLTETPCSRTSRHDRPVSRRTSRRRRPSDDHDDARRSRRSGHMVTIDRAQQQQAGDVVVPRQRVPAVRRADLHLHALPRPAHAARPARRSCGTSR